MQTSLGFFLFFLRVFEHSPLLPTYLWVHPSAVPYTTTVCMPRTCTLHCHQQQTTTALRTKRISFLAFDLDEIFKRKYLRSKYKCSHTHAYVCYTMNDDSLMSKQCTVHKLNIKVYRYDMLFYVHWHTICLISTERAFIVQRFIMFKDCKWRQFIKILIYVQICMS